MKEQIPPRDISFEGQLFPLPFLGLVRTPGHWSFWKSIVATFTSWHCIFSDHQNINDLSSLSELHTLFFRVLKSNNFPPSSIHNMLFCHPAANQYLSQSLQWCKGSQKKLMCSMFGYRWEMGMLKDMEERRFVLWLSVQ